MASKNFVYVVQHNHFDPIWRRGWLRAFDYKGKRYQPYALLERMVFDIWLESAKRGATFSEGQAVIIRRYLESRPEALPVMRDLVTRGLMEVTAAGETVSDTNMPSGETLLRNMVLGQLWFDEVLGVTPSVGWLEDAFGQSAQMPQIFRGCEVKHVVKLSYKRVPGSYWRGLDGSVIFTLDAPVTHGAGDCFKIPPCPQCRGMGCAVCDGTGYGEEGRITDKAVRDALAQDYNGDPFSMLSVGGEESIPNPNLPELVAEAQAGPDAADFRWGTWADLAREYADQIAKVDDPNIEISDDVEANCTSTGCYVTRIRIKQDMRRVENLINSTERWATVAHLLGAEYPSDALLQAWRDVIFIGFHDAITSTHIDQAYFELLDMLAQAECTAEALIDETLDVIESKIKSDPKHDYLVLYNSESWERSDPVTVTLSGVQGRPTLRDAFGKEIDILDVTAEGQDVSISFRAPSVPALGYTAVQIVTDTSPIDNGEVTTGPGEIENEYFKLKVSDKGIESIVDKRIGEELLDTGKYLANELLLEEDIGHPWGTMQMPSFEEGLSQYTTEVKIRKAENVSEIIILGQYKGKDPNTKILSWRQSVMLYKGVDRIDFHTIVDWDTAQRRIRVVFPTNIKTSDGIWSIPYGAVKRWKYEPDMGCLCSTNGDWPAINWVDIYGEGEGRGVALVNTGMPSHKIEDGVIYMSVLRSPTDSWCLNEPEYYDCSDFDGARDAGQHEFHYSLIPHQGDYKAANIEKRGREINNPLIVRALEYAGDGDYGLSHSFLNLDATDNIIITAVKKAENDDSIIVRLAETDGVEGSASVGLPGAKAVSMVNYLERQDEPISGDKVHLAPFKIATVRLRKD